MLAVNKALAAVVTNTAKKKIKKNQELRRKLARYKALLSKTKAQQCGCGRFLLDSAYNSHKVLCDKCTLKEASCAPLQGRVSRS